MSRTNASANPAPPSSFCAASYHRRRRCFTESEEIASRRVGRIHEAACLTPGPIGTPERYWLADELRHCCVETGQSERVQLEADRKWWPVAPARQPRLKGVVYVVNGSVARIRAIDPDGEWQRDDRGYADVPLPPPLSDL
jgi:hypothetical protein